MHRRVAASSCDAKIRMRDKVRSPRAEICAVRLNVHVEYAFVPVIAAGHAAGTFLPGPIFDKAGAKHDLTGPPEVSGRADVPQPPNEDAGSDALSVTELDDGIDDDDAAAEADGCAASTGPGRQELDEVPATCRAPRDPNPGAFYRQLCKGSARPRRCTRSSISVRTST